MYVVSMLIVTPIVGFCNCSMFCCVLPYVHSSFEIILMGKRELVALLCLSRDCCGALSPDARGLSAFFFCLHFFLWYFLIILTYYFWL